jgi:hypothetical protein
MAWLGIKLGHQRRLQQEIANLQGYPRLWLLTPERRLLCNDGVTLWRPLDGHQISRALTWRGRYPFEKVYLDLGGSIQY